MDEKELQEFSLEEIIEEFKDADEEIAQNQEAVVSEEFEEVPEEIEEVPEDFLEEEEEPEMLPEEELPQSSLDETIRISGMNDIPLEHSAMEQTIRLDAITEVVGVVHDVQPVTEAQEAAAVPYSQEWEPEYEQPIGDYVPAPPIIFQPRSRLQELKRQLVAGPERLYYDLLEKGNGKLQVKLFLSVMVVLLGAVSTLLYSLDMVQDNRMRLMVFVQFLAMLLSALLGSAQLIEGAGALLRGKFTRNTLLCFTFLACCVDGVICLQQLKVPCCAAFSLEITAAIWRDYQIRNTRMSRLDTMRKATRLDSVCAAEAYFEEDKGLLRGEGQVEDFMDTLSDSQAPEQPLDKYALIALILSVCVGIAAAVLHNVSFGIRAMAVALIAAMPATIFIAITRPAAVLENKLRPFGVVLCGWQGVEGLCGKAVFPLTHMDLFPQGSIRINGMKFYTPRDPDEITAYAAAMVIADGGSLVPLFSEILESRNGMHYGVENFREYEGGGIGGKVNGEAVLVGTLEFLQRMGVEVPEGIRVNQTVSIAIDGELCGVFAVNYEKVRASSAGISALCAYRGLRTVLINNDFMLTADYIQSKFGVNMKRFVFPDANVRMELQEKKADLESKPLLLVTKEGLAPCAYGIVGARALQSACKAGILLHIIGGAIGIATMALLAILGAQELLVPGNIFLYQLIWMIPGLMITEWTRTL